MRKPSAVEEIILRGFLRESPDWPLEALWGSYHQHVTGILAALDAAGYEVKRKPESEQ